MDEQKYPQRAQTANERAERTKKEGKKKKRHSLIAILILAVIALGIYFGYSYIQDYYRASESAQEILEQDAAEDGITVTEADGQITFAPENPVAGFIFYPGGKVEYTAYAPLLYELAKNDIFCVLVHMPANLAVLDQNAAKGIPEAYPEISTWYIGGHSLGGAMAASYVSKHTDEYAGLFLLAAYSTADLSESNLSVTCIYGANDGVMNREKYEKYKANLPEASTQEIVIDGGIHSYFGDYGLQDGDGTPEISRAEQVETTVDFMTMVIKGTK